MASAGATWNNRHMRRVGAVLAVFFAMPAGAGAMPSVRGGSAFQVFGPVTGNADHIPNLVDLSAPNAGGDHVASFLDADTTEDTQPHLFGRVLGPSGRPARPAVRWSRADADLFNAGAAVGRSGETGLAVWHEDDPDSPAVGNLVTRPFDARTAKPTAEESQIDRATYLYDVEAYLGGYVALYRTRVPGTRSLHVLQRLDAQGQPDGNARELSRSRNAFNGLLAGHPSRKRLALVTTPFSNVVDFEILGPDGDSQRKRVGGIRDDYLLDVSHGSGGAWMTLWAREVEDEELNSSYRLMTRRLTARAELRRPVFLTRPASGFPTAEVSYNGRQGLVLARGRGRCPEWRTIPLDARGEPQLGRPDRLSIACGSRRTGPAFERLAPSTGARRFLFGLSTFTRGAEHFIRAFGIRVQR